MASFFLAVVHAPYSHRVPAVAVPPSVPGLRHGANAQLGRRPPGAEGAASDVGGWALKRLPFGCSGWTPGLTAGLMPRRRSLIFRPPPSALARGHPRGVPTFLCPAPPIAATRQSWPRAGHRGVASLSRLKTWVPPAGGGGGASPPTRRPRAGARFRPYARPRATREGCAGRSPGGGSPRPLLALRGLRLDAFAPPSAAPGFAAARPPLA